MTDASVSPSTAPRARLGCSAGVLAFVATAFVTLGGAVYLFRDPLPPLTEPLLMQARERWTQANLANYRLRLNVAGDQPGEYFVSVADGSPTSVLRNGREPPRRTWSYWTVDGLFDVLQTYLDMQAQAEAGSREPGCTRAVLQVEFDPQSGLPRRFRRNDLDNGRVVEWEILEFSPSTP